MRLLRLIPYSRKLLDTIVKKPFYQTNVWGMLEA